MPEAKRMTFAQAFGQVAEQMHTQGQIDDRDLFRVRFYLLFHARQLQTLAAQNVIAAGLVQATANVYAASTAWDWSAFLAAIMQLIQMLLELFAN